MTLKKEWSVSNIITISVLVGGLILQAGWYQRDIADLSEETMDNEVSIVENRERIKTLELQANTIEHEIKALRTSHEKTYDLIKAIANDMNIKVRP